jgi:hypothetical protein
MLLHSLAAAQAALQACLVYLCTYSCSLWTRLASCLAASSGKMTPCGALHVYLRSCANKKYACSKKKKLAQVNESEFERTHPRAFDPFP